MSRAVCGRIGLYFGLLQMVFGLAWVEYSIFLPQLAATAGIGGVASWILVLDQLIFAVCDLAVGVAFDRVVEVVSRLGTIIVVVTGVSAVVFLLLPVVAPFNAGVFVALIAVWAITSTAVRAPALALLGRYASVGQQPWVGSLFVIGIGLATASAPILATRVTDYDVRLQFGLSAFAVFAVALAITWAEKALTRTARPEHPAPTEIRFPTFLLFMASVLLLQTGFQVYWFINEDRFFEPLAEPGQRPALSSLFWVGFTFLMPLASLLARRFGSVICVMAGLIGAAAGLAAAQADDLVSLGIAHFIAGGAWGAVMTTTVTMTFAIVRRGRAGTAAGGFFSMVALAAMMRVALVAAHGDKVPAVASALRWLPSVSWLMAVLVLLPVARRPHRQNPRV